MACPHVSGAGGQLTAQGKTNIEARSTLKSSAEDIGLSSTKQGSGLLDVEAAVNGSSDSAPSVPWVNPSDGATVSETVTIQIDASDAEDSDDSLTVEYNIDGGSPQTTSYNTDSGYYEDPWDSTGVSDGDHTLEAQATDSASNTTTTTITVTTDNTDSTPTNEAPTADFETSRKGKSANVTLDGSSSTDSDGSIVSYEWDVGNDRSFEYTGEVVENADVPAGTDVLLQVTDDDGATDSTTKTVA